LFKFKNNFFFCGWPDLKLVQFYSGQVKYLSWTFSQRQVKFNWPEVDLFLTCLNYLTWTIHWTSSIDLGQSQPWINTCLNYFTGIQELLWIAVNYSELLWILVNWWNNSELLCFAVNNFEKIAENTKSNKQIEIFQKKVCLVHVKWTQKIVWRLPDGICFRDRPNNRIATEFKKTFTWNGEVFNLNRKTTYGSHIIYDRWRMADRWNFFRSKLLFFIY
jgi:hypothetical protein